MHYIFRTTTDQLAASMDRVVDSGDQILWPVFTGGRDWVLVCIKADA